MLDSWAESTLVFICRAETIQDKYSTHKGEISRRGETNELNSEDDTAGKRLYGIVNSGI